ncbi:hypothetical protein [Planomonospora venezuelensis]|uniref:Secreted protein n=1 Tax=Planomonospora venezuelensis TaxID=1999 RepID=A0A841DB51_PLAVE|nr:hypothetical protein [Planomonospora venezuelensis]MBB5965967.1 hypothetical protein [Planomonospora venezuelensis]GIN01280.1 hypothetical protein Pve01_29380 [Planomonospora venezuelensis]
MNVRLLPAAALLALALTACSGSEPGGDGVASAAGGTAKPTASASSSAPADPQEAQLKFAQCMREHGVDMEDPDGSGRVRIKAGPGDQAETEKAMKECQPLMENAVKDRGPQSPQDRDRMLKYAQCMREHGVDMPDPGPDGRMQLRLTPGNEQKLEEAEEACREFAPGAGGQQ